jgi:hypothetical protein
LTAELRAEVKRLDQRIDLVQQNLQQEMRQGFAEVDRRLETIEHRQAMIEQRTEHRIQLLESHVEHRLQLVETQLTSPGAPPNTT